MSYRPIVYDMSILIMSLIFLLHGWHEFGGVFFSFQSALDQPGFFFSTKKWTDTGKSVFLSAFDPICEFPLFDNSVLWR